MLGLLPAEAWHETCNLVGMANVENSTENSSSKNSSADGKLEGEGSYTGTRKYNQGLAEHQQTADVEGLAEKAREAVEGEEGEELREAEERGKRGPNTSSQGNKPSGENRKA